MQLKLNKIYSFDDVQKFQKTGFMSSDIIFDGKNSDKFILIKVPINSIKINEHKIKNSNGTDEDQNIILKLIKMYKNGSVNPLVIDENNNIMDGLHRYSAQRKLKMKDIFVFKRIQNTKKEIKEMKITKINEKKTDDFYDKYGKAKYDYLGIAQRMPIHYSKAIKFYKEGDYFNAISHAQAYIKFCATGYGDLRKKETMEIIRDRSANKEKIQNPLFKKNEENKKNYLKKLIKECLNEQNLGSLYLAIKKASTGKFDRTDINSGDWSVNMVHDYPNITFHLYLHPINNREHIGTYNGESKYDHTGRLTVGELIVFKKEYEKIMKNSLEKAGYKVSKTVTESIKNKKKKILNDTSVNDTSTKRWHAGSKQLEKDENECQECGDEDLKEKTDPEWESTVMAMKKHKEIDNPWRLANWMKNQGYTSHK